MYSDTDPQFSPQEKGQESGTLEEMDATNENTKLSDEQTDVIRKLKELVEMGILTEEEYNTKKKQVLEEE